MTTNIRTILIISVVIVLIIAIFSFTYIMIRVYKIKKKIKEDEINLENKLSEKESEKAMRNREDFGKPLYELKYLLEKTKEHEVVEFCINTCIRNNFQNILLIGNVEIYEAICISNKANANVVVLSSDFQNDLYDKIKDKLKDISFKLDIVNNVENSKFDSIICLDTTNEFISMFEKYFSLLKNKGMFIFGKAKIDKKKSLALIKVLKSKKIKYDLINWYSGFLLIVK